MSIVALSEAPSVVSPTELTIWLALDVAGGVDSLPPHPLAGSFSKRLLEIGSAMSPSARLASNADGLTLIANPCRRLNTRTPCQSSWEIR